MTGIEVPETVAISVLVALRDACTSRRPLRLLALAVSPENAYLATRAEVAEQFHMLEQHTFALAILRRKTPPDALLLVVIGDDLPHLRTIDLRRVRYALASIRNPKTLTAARQP